MMDLTERVPVRWEERTVRLLEGQQGLGVGFVAVTGVAVSTVLDRFIFVPFVYGGVRDVIVHLSAELLAGVTSWGACWLFLTFWLWATRFALARRHRRTVAHVALAGLFGTAFGLFACDTVLRHSAYWGFAPPAVWWLGSVLLGVLLSAVAFRALARPVPPQARLIGAAVSLFALALHVWSLHHDLQRYGNLLALVQCASPLLVAIGAMLVAADAPVLVVPARAVAFLAAVAALVLALSVPSYSARRAVLVSGATAKQLVLRVLWPLLDRDGDGAPSRFWGTDPDDADPKTTPPSMVTSSARLPRVPLTLPPPGEPPRNVLWIIVDTVRVDSFERALANDATLRSSFSSFAYYSNYSSCSSRTYLVLAQLFDAFRCDTREVIGVRGSSLLEMLRSARFRDELYSYYVPTVAFQKSVRIRDEGKLLRATARAVNEPSSEPRAVFLHLKGGHEEYDAPGRTSRERYENQLVRSLREVAELVREALPERWVVVIMGDHGEAFGEHDSVAHATTLYEEVLRTPLLIRASNLTAGTLRERLGCSDVAWRVLEGARVIGSTVPTLPYQYALLDLARAQGVRAQRDSIRSLRRAEWKVLWRPQLGIWELYDLEHDPKELRSLTESRPREFGVLRSELERLSAACGVAASSATSGSSPATL